MQIRQNITAGAIGKKYMPYSEACMHLKLAGKEVFFTVTEGKFPMVQLLNKDLSPISFPVTLGEAGVKVDGDSFYYYPNSLSG